MVQARNRWYAKYYTFYTYNAFVAVTALYMILCTPRSCSAEMRFVILYYINDNTCARLPIIRAAVECAAGKRKAKRLSSLPPSDLFFKVYIPKSLCPHAAADRRRISLRYRFEFWPIYVYIVCTARIFFFSGRLQ